MPKLKKRTRPHLAPKSLNLKPGEPMWVKEEWWVTCCDCGLRHHVTISKQTEAGKGFSRVQTNDNLLLLKVYRDDYGTEVIRHERRIEVIEKPKGRKLIKNA